MPQPAGWTLRLHSWVSHHWGPLNLCPHVQILITGHSLGGALATLAAYDIQAAAEAQCPIKVHCMVYSFGAPRVGNHAFARDYRRMVRFSTSHCCPAGTTQPLGYPAKC